MKHPWRLTVTRNRGHAYFWLMLMPRPWGWLHAAQDVAGPDALGRARCGYQGHRETSITRIRAERKR
jgi:hypothetical protein